MYTLSHPLVQKVGQVIPTLRRSLLAHCPWTTVKSDSAAICNKPRKVLTGQVLKGFHFEPPISAQDGWKSYPHCP
jgi:hypothetical protein